MTISRDRSEFDILGIDFDSSQMMILRAVLAAAGGPSQFVTYKEISERLQELEKREYSKAYIYRHLAALKDEEYISIEEEIGQPRQYQILESGIEKTLVAKHKEARDEIENREKEILEKLELLEKIDPESVAFIIYNRLLGKETDSNSVVIEGIENVRNTVIREFGTAAKPGDKIRVIAPSNIVGTGKLEHAGMAELSLLRRAVDDVKVIGLIVPAKGSTASVDLIRDYLANIGEAFTNLARTGNIVLRVAEENINTYRMVSLNREKMLLYLTHAADSDMAALILRKDNPGLIDDAVDTFDSIIEKSMDVSESLQHQLANQE